MRDYNDLVDGVVSVLECWSIGIEVLQMSAIRLESQHLIRENTLAMIVDFWIGSLVTVSIRKRMLNASL